MAVNTTAYYDRTATTYDDLHGGDPRHDRGLELSMQFIARLSIESVLDIGCGTGRSLQWLRARDGRLQMFGVEPSLGMLEIARRNLPGAVLKQGKGEQLAFENDSVDLAVATGIMHHVDDPACVIAEMFRVARKAVLICDHNNFAFGGPLARRVRLALYACGLLSIATWMKQGFRRQGYSQDDGWWYPYSLLDNYSDIHARASEVYIFPTTGNSQSDDVNFLLAQSHLAVFAVKRR